ncbi:MAG: DUF4162 domain-containing protein, partial [Bacteroidaceae bacterium]|nr:DUF4162 domain-containing protein [Bacteroidaceae bacterium]
INRSQVVLEGAVDEVRNRYRTGTFELVVEQGTLDPRPELYTIEGSTQHRSLTTYQLRKSPDLTTSQLLGHLATQPLAIRSFTEQMPSMHEIFVQTVSAANHE